MTKHLGTFGTIIALLLLAACGGGGSSTPSLPLPINSKVTGSVSLSENGQSINYTVDISALTGPASYSLSGTDRALFTLTTAGGLSFTVAPDFENPTDANGDNVYDVILTISDGRNSVELTLSITILDVVDNFQVRRIATGFALPLFVTGLVDGTNRVYVVGKQGGITILDTDTGIVDPTPFLSIRPTISTVGERGLLGFALAPDFLTSQIFYVAASNVDGDTEIRRYQTTANLDIADPASVDVILTIAQPASNHNGGWLAFGPDGYLYFASGDGGGGSDQFGHGQNPNTLLAAILRIDPSGDDFPADDLRDYAIPADNPFVSGGGAPEVWAYGLRNPFRCSFDRVTGDLYIADVGQGAIEEIDIAPAGVGGLNFGWSILEGTRVNAAGSTVGLTMPVAEYPHGTGPTEGNSVTGGYVYRGPVEALQGHYIFADYVRANIWSLAPDQLVPGTTTPNTAFTVQTSNFIPDFGTIENISSFGEDAAGNLYIVDINGEIFRFEQQ